MNAQMLFELEKSLFDNSLTKDFIWLNNIIHDNFREITDTGRVIFKEEVLEKMSHCHYKLEFEVNNFDYVEINSFSWLVTYIVAYGNVREYHSSIWSKIEDDNMQIVFHQVSPLLKEVELVPYKG